MTRGIVIDGWNLFDYNGIKGDKDDKKTLAVKSLGDDYAEIYLVLPTFSFELDKNGTKFGEFERFSTCLKLADEWFKGMKKDVE